MTNPEDHNDRPELEGQTADPEDDNDKPELEGQTGRAKAPGAEKRETSTPDTSHSDTEHHKPSDTNQNSTETDSNKTAVSDTESAQASDEATVKPESKDALKKESEEDDLKDVLIYSGEYGGKSTVIGGALQHLYEKDDIIVTYEVEFGEASQFEEHLIRPMIDDGEYPPNTEFPYVTRFDLSFDSRRREDAGIRFVDFPGSWLERSVDLPPNPDPESVQPSYSGETGIRSKIEKDNNLTDNDIQAFLTHHYTKADCVILLLNLERIMNDDIPFAYDLELVREIAEEVESAVVVTGVDVIDYNPSEEGQTRNKALQMVKNRLGIGREESVNQELLEMMIQDIPQGSNPQLHNILRGIKSGCGADFFGVAVPSDADGGIVEGGNGFETRGFDQIINWVLSQ